MFACLSSFATPCYSHLLMRRRHLSGHDANYSLNPPDNCVQACSQGSCCYVSSSYPPIEQLFDKYYGVNNNPMKTAASCTANIGFCQQYGSCEHLNRLQDTSGWNSGGTNYKLQIGSVCMAEYIAKNGALECSNVCQPAHCCFSPEYLSACSDTTLRDFNCDNYAQCQILYPSQKNAGEERTSRKRDLRCRLASRC